LIARVISPANGRPGCTSRGAIQQRIAAFSSVAQTASATRLFFVEWEIKTSCTMGSGMDRFYLFVASLATRLCLGFVGVQRAHALPWLSVGRRGGLLFRRHRTHYQGR
jgi:hypothetical protein